MYSLSGLWAMPAWGSAKNVGPIRACGVTAIGTESVCPAERLALDKLACPNLPLFSGSRYHNLAHSIVVI